MYQPEAYSIALLFMLGSMLCWGSWANTMKLTPGWPFQLFYWDYVAGIIVASLVWGFKWEGNSQKEVRSWPKEVKENIGLELDRLEHQEEPLDSKWLGKVLPGVQELRDEFKGVWYRLMYWLNAGWIYVLHCFNKKTNQTSQGDIEIARHKDAGNQGEKGCPRRKGGEKCVSVERKMYSINSDSPEKRRQLWE